MGQIADDIIEGRCCEMCGEYFTGPDGLNYAHGYPVICVECWKEHSLEVENKFQQAKRDLE